MNIEDFNPEEFTREEEEARQKREFRDFLVVREIAGTLTGVPESSRIPAELLIDTGGVVELASEHTHQDEGDAAQPTVLIHRDENDDIESVEVLCTCGKKTHIRFKYGQ